MVRDVLIPLSKDEMFAVDFSADFEVVLLRPRAVASELQGDRIVRPEILDFHISLSVDVHGAEDNIPDQGVGSGHDEMVVVVFEFEVHCAERVELHVGAFELRFDVGGHGEFVGV